jgi:hypothetical protein
MMGLPPALLRAEHLLDKRELAGSLAETPVSLPGSRNQGYSLFYKTKLLAITSALGTLRLIYFLLPDSHNSCPVLALAQVVIFKNGSRSK